MFFQDKSAESLRISQIAMIRRTFKYCGSARI
jgi:hypothetical protein